MDRTVLTVLDGALGAAITTLEALKAALSFKFSLFDMFLAPLRAAYEQLKKKVDEARQKLNIIPIEYVLVCPELGLLQQYLQMIIDQLLEQIENILQQIEDLLNIQLGLGALISLFDTLIAFLQSIRECIQTVLAIPEGI
jgi:hypothetical protein